MKIKSIAQICKQNTSIFIYGGRDEGSPQWIGNGEALYQIAGLPELDEESICTIFDTPEKKRDDYTIHIGSLPHGLNFDNSDYDEMEIEPEGVAIISGSKTLIPLNGSNGIILIDKQYTSPLADVAGLTKYYERIARDGTPYVAVKMGFLILAVIAAHPVTAELAESVARIGAQCKRAAEREETATHHTTAPQMVFDADTGEIYESEEERQ